MKHIGFLQLYREDAAVAASRGAAADSGVAGGWGGVPYGFSPLIFIAFDELPMETQNPVLVLHNRRLWSCGVKMLFGWSGL